MLYNNCLITICFITGSVISKNQGNYIQILLLLLFIVGLVSNNFTKDDNQTN